MAIDLINERGDIIGTRMTVYDLLPHFLDPTATETYLCRLYELTPQQVAAARAHILNNLDTVLAQHLKIEARIATGNPPEVIEQAKRTQLAMQQFKAWLAQQAEASQRDTESAAASAQNGRQTLPSFREWFAQRQQAEAADEGS
jgi:G3E family GTPase